MALVVGNLIHIATAALMSAIGGMLLCQRLAIGRLPIFVCHGLLIGLLLFLFSLVSQDSIAAMGYLIKLILLTLFGFWAWKAPRTVATLLMFIGVTLFLVEALKEGVSKTNAFPLRELSLILPLLAIASNRPISSGVVWILNISFGSLFALQGLVLGSRGFLLFGGLIILLSCIPWRSLVYAMRRFWLFPVLYVVMMAALGLALTAWEAEYVEITKSNVERTVMLGILLKTILSEPFGVNQAVFSAEAGALIGAFGIKAYSEEMLDPHNFIAYTLMYSGWFGAIIALIYARKAAHFIAFDDPRARAVLVPMLSAFLSASISPPSTWERHVVIGTIVILAAVVVRERWRLDRRVQD